MKTKEKAEFGDFQTPSDLAIEVCRLLHRLGIRPRSLLEPTCGRGNFLLAALAAFDSVEQVRGLEINPNYVRAARDALARQSKSNLVEVIEADFFHFDLHRLVRELREPILAVGNPPWVTNSELSALMSTNLPVKSNFQRRKGLDAITGKANFDISEWMLTRLLELLEGKEATLAMLCKSAVARKVLTYGWKHGFQITKADLFQIEADLHFDAAVDASLLVVQFGPDGSRRASVSQGLQAKSPSKVIGYEDELLLADVGSYRQWKHLRGENSIKWRSGIKHDCSKVMELRKVGDRFRNGFGELVELEDEYLFPLLKSSDVAKGVAAEGYRWIIVTQKRVNQDTSTIQEAAPRTWSYLQRNRHYLEARTSSIYRQRPAFSIFGVGDYTFLPWKVAISGFYKKLQFTPLGMVEGKPVAFDDTSYFLGCENHEQAALLAELLNSPVAKAFYESFIFWDGKRPITAEILQRLSLRRVAQELSIESRFDAAFQARIPGTAEPSDGVRRQSELQWTDT